MLPVRQCVCLLIKGVSAVMFVCCSPQCGCRDAKEQQQQMLGQVRNPTEQHSSAASVGMLFSKLCQSPATRSFAALQPQLAMAGSNVKWRQHAHVCFS